MTLRTLATSCAKDYKGNSLVQTSFIEPPNTSQFPDGRGMYIDYQEERNKERLQVYQTNLNLPGLWTPVRMRMTAPSLFMVLHQIWFTQLKQTHVSMTAPSLHGAAPDLVHTVKANTRHCL